MKLYPSLYNVIGRESILPGDVQLAYIDKDHKEKSYRLIENNQKSFIEKRESVFPYEEFNRPDPYLFDKNNNLVSVAADMIRGKDTYAFFPEDALEFTPEYFDFRVSIKRENNYDSSKNVNIKVGVIEKHDIYQDALIRIFGDAYRKNLITSNFKVNNGDLLVESLTNSSYEENDLVIIQSNDFSTLWDSGEKFEMSDFFDEHTNVWIALDDNSNLLSPTNDIREIHSSYAVTGGALYKTKTFEDTKIDYSVNMELIRNMIGNDYQYVDSIFKSDEPVVIFHKRGQGYLFVSHESVIINSEENYKMIYEILNFIYTRGYEKTNWISGWITESVVDYLPRKESIFGRKHERYLIGNLLLKDSNADRFTINKVEINEKDKVALSAVGNDNELLFEKIGPKTDPLKGSNQRSYLTTRKTVIFYEENDVNRLEQPLSFWIEKTNKGDYLKINPFKSTELETNIEQLTVLRIPDTPAQYCLILKENFFELKRYSKGEAIDGYMILLFEAFMESKVKSYDTRIMGGGLPLRKEGNYNLFDIGHFSGRPHRLGGAVVIELPERAKEYEDIIEKAIDRHIVSGEYFALTYREEQ